MRIIGGKFRSRKIKQPKSALTRPTKDRIREAVFNVISEKVLDSVVLDLFAGSGAYGLEALSRSAKKAIFVEDSSSSSRTIKENLALLGLEEYSELIVKDVSLALKKLSKAGETFNLVFSDPPYNIGMAKKTLIMINQYDILKSSGLLIIEHSKEEDIPELEGSLSLLKKKTYGDIAISIYQRQ